MAAYKEEADIGDIVADEQELEMALCVLAGSDPENCSYSRVRKCFLPRRDPAAITAVSPALF